MNTTLFLNRFTKVYNECFHIKMIKSGYKTRKPWLCDSLKKAIKKKNRLYKVKVRSGDPVKKNHITKNIEIA